MLTSRIWCFLCLLSYLQGFNFNPNYHCSMNSEIHHLQLKFAFFLLFFLNCGWTFGESNSNKSLADLVNFRNKAVSIYLALMIFNFITANSVKWGEMLARCCCPLKKIVYASWKIFEIFGELRDGDSGRLGNRSTIFLENNSSTTSHLPLNLGIFRTDEIWRL